MTDFDSNSPIVQKIWDRLRTMLGAKVFKIKSNKDLEKVAKRYKTLSGYEKHNFFKKSNAFQIIKEEKMTTFVKGYEKNGVKYKGYYRPAYVRWTKKELIKLNTYKAKGRTIPQISSYLGRSQLAVKNKLR